MKIIELKGINVCLLMVMLFFVISAGTCDKPPLGERFYAVKVNNNTSDTIYSGLGLGNGHPFMQYPDTTLPINRPSLMHIRPQNNFSFFARKPYQQIVDELIADTLSIFIFKKNIYQDSSWISIRNNYLVLKRYDLSLMI